MDGDDAFFGAVMASANLLNGLMGRLVAKGVLTPQDRTEIFDAALYSLEQHEVMLPARAEAFRQARKQLEAIMKSHR